MKPIFLGTPKGDHNEKKFLAVVNKRTRHTPRWFDRVLSSSPTFDVKGVDAIAKIKRPDDPKPMSVPVQVKSSQGGKRAFYEKHPEAKRLGVLVIVLEPGATGDAIRQELYHLLEPFLHGPRHHFKEYLSGLGRSRLGKRGNALRALLMKNRKEKK